MKRKSLFLGLDKFPTQTAAERHLEAFVLKLNQENPTLAVMEPTFDAILDRFIEDERMMEIKQSRLEAGKLEVRPVSAVSSTL